ARTYRFAPPDRTGWLLGMGGPQVVILGAAVVVAVLLASAHARLAAVAVPVALGAAVAFTRVGGQPLVEAAPPTARFAVLRAMRRHRWLAPLALPAVGLTPPLP